jgi:hypothetical protein
MRENIVLPALILALASCHTHSDTGGGKKPNTIRFNPTEGSAYQYKVTNQINMAVIGSESDTDMARKSELDVNFQVSKDDNEIVLGMTFDRIHLYQRDGQAVAEIDNSGGPAGSKPLVQLLRDLKTDTLYARMQPSGFTTGEGEGVIEPIVNAFYPEADRAQMRKNFQQWVHSGIISYSLDPLVWASADSAHYPADHWIDTIVERDGLDYRIERHLEFESVHSGVANIRSTGRILEDSIYRLFGQKIQGHFTGIENGLCLVDVATGMLDRLLDSIAVEGRMPVRGREARIKLVKTIDAHGTKIKN